MHLENAFTIEHDARRHAIHIIFLTYSVGNYRCESCPLLIHITDRLIFRLQKTGHGLNGTAAVPLLSLLHAIMI